MSSFQKTIDIAIEPNSYPNIALTTLRQLGWESIFIDQGLHKIAAQKLKQENVLGVEWQYFFRLTIAWTTQSERLSLDVEVTEDNYAWTIDECRKHFQSIESSLKKPSSPLIKPGPKSNGARWATAKELVSAGYIDDYCGPQNLILSGDGIFFTRLPAEDSYKHALVCGPTGSGKTTGIFVPNLIERVDCSALITEATGSRGRADLYCKTAGWRAAHGHQIYSFNPDDLSSHRINALDSIKTYRDARRIAEIIMQSTTLASHKGDQAWEMSERLLLTALILHAVSMRKSELGSLAYVFDLLCLGTHALCDVLDRSALEEARKTFFAFERNSSEAYRNLVAQGLVTRLSLWAEPRIRKLTEKTDIDFATLQKELFTIYLSTPAAKPELKPLAALTFNVVFEAVSSQDFKYPLALFLDEFTNFGYIRAFPQKLTILRHDRIPVVLGIQDYLQLELLYGKEAGLFLSQPGTKIFFRPNDLATAERISKALGMAETINTRVTSAGQLDESTDRKPLLSVEDLLALESSEMIAFVPRTRPARLKAFTWQQYTKQTNEDIYRAPQRAGFDIDDFLIERHQSRQPIEKAAVQIAELKGGW